MIVVDTNIITYRFIEGEKTLIDSIQNKISAYNTQQSWLLNKCIIKNERRFLFPGEKRRNNTFQ
jgi:hypothetical protein